MFKILLCDNDLSSIKLDILKKYEVDIASSKDDILNLTFENDYDLFIVHIYYFTIIKELKSSDSIKEAKVIFLDEYYQISHLKKAYDIGDDYILKPINLEELDIKVQYHYKKIYTNTQNIIKYKNFFFYTNLKHLYQNSKKIKLSPNESKLLYMLLTSLNKNITKIYLLKELQTSDATLRVYISKLNKLGFNINYERVNSSYMLTELK